MNFIQKLKNQISDLKYLPEATYLCWKYPFLKSWKHKNKFFQTWCWYYAIPTGWRKAFGKQMLNEIRKSLLETDGKRALKAMSIQDIKEKWGQLAFYCSSTRDVFNIIHKYEYISAHTCIECGKPAQVQTTGWICPYCEEHVGDRHCIHFGHKNGPHWYGWMGNIWDVPKEKWEDEENYLNEEYGSDNSNGREKASN